MLPSLSLLQNVVLPVPFARKVDRAGLRERAMAQLDMASLAIFALVPWTDSTRFWVQPKVRRNRDRGAYAPLPHHRTCGSASGGSVKYDEVHRLRVESFLSPFDPVSALAPDAYLTPSALLPRPVRS